MPQEIVSVELFNLKKTTNIGEKKISEPVVIAITKNYAFAFTATLDREKQSQLCQISLQESIKKGLYIDGAIFLLSEDGCVLVHWIVDYSLETKEKTEEMKKKAAETKNQK